MAEIAKWVKSSFCSRASHNFRDKSGMTTGIVQNQKGVGKKRIEKDQREANHNSLALVEGRIFMDSISKGREDHLVLGSYHP